MFPNKLDKSCEFLSCYFVIAGLNNLLFAAPLKTDKKSFQFKKGLNDKMLIEWKKVQYLPEILMKVNHHPYNIY